MKKSPIVLLVAILATFVSSARATDTPDKIVNRYKKAAGTASRRIENTLMTGTARSGDSASGRFYYRAAGPDRLRMDIEAGGTKVTECYNGKSAWRQDSRGLRTLLGTGASSLRLLAILANSRMRDLSRARVMIRPARSAPPDGIKRDGIDFLSNGVQATVFFDRDSGLPSVEEVEKSDGMQVYFFSDYRKIDGVMEPFSIRVKESGAETVVSIEKVEHNQPLRDTDFRFPEIGGAPLPEVDKLLKTIVANQEQVEQLQERYTFRAVETQHKQDDKGNAKETETKVYEVIPVAGNLIHKLISVNGKELAGAEKEKEEHRVQKEIEDSVKRQEKRKEKKEKAEQQGKQSEDKGDVTVSMFLRVTQVSSVRREVFHGQEVIAFDFEPRKNFTPHGLGETLASKFAGTMWVDQNALQIARMEAHLIDSFKIGGGLLASVSPSSYLIFEQEKIDGDVWLPSYAEANVMARLLLLKKLKLDATTRYSDYKKYHIDSEYKYNKPKDADKPQQ
jgi:hypothetical protein